jgi:hypothetical protein
MNENEIKQQLRPKSQDGVAGKPSYRAKGSDDLVNFEAPNDRRELSPNAKKTTIAAFGKLINDQQLNSMLKVNFQKSLAKLNENPTKEVGFSELKNMIVKFNTQDALRIYISCLGIYYNNCTLGAKELQVLLLGYVASVFRENLLDPLDKPSSIIKTIVRISEIIQMYLKVSKDITLGK